MWRRKALIAPLAWVVLIVACNSGGNSGGTSSYGNHSEAIGSNSEIHVVAASPIRDGDGVNTIVDGDPDDGYISADLPFSFILSLGRRAVIRKVEIIWGSEKDYAVDYTVEDVGYASTVDEARRYGEIVSVQGASGKVQTMDFATLAPQASFLRIRITSVSSQLAVIRQVRLTIDPPDTAQKIILDNRNDIFLSTLDSNNALSIFKLPVTMAMKRLGDYILEQHGDLSDHQKIVLFMTYLNSSRIGFSSSSAPETTLLEGFGACGSWTNVLLSLAAAQGLPGRVIGLYNYPPDNGHVVAELFVDGRWQVYDPTYAAYYTSEPDNEVNPIVLDFEDLEDGLGAVSGYFRVVKNPDRLSAGGEAALSFVGPEIYFYAEPRGVIGPDQPMVFPLWLDLVDKPSMAADDFGPENQGAWILGSAFVNVSQEFTLSGLTAGQRYDFIVKYRGVENGSSSSKEFTANSRILQGGILEMGADYRYEDGFLEKPWTIRFTAESDTLNLLLTHDYLTPSYLVVDSYTLAPYTLSSLQNQHTLIITGSETARQPTNTPNFPFTLRLP